MKLILFSLVLLLAQQHVSMERVNSISTKVNSCLTCGMIEGLGYITVKVLRVLSNVMMMMMIDDDRCVAVLTVVSPGVWTVMVSTGSRDKLTSSRESKYNSDRNCGGLS